MRPPPRTMRSGFLQHFRVIHALMLRDIKTRMGASYFGFFFGMLMPLGHIGVIMTIYVVLGRRAPIGTEVVLYLATAILPFICWSYTHQKVLASFNANRALTSFPIVKFTDIWIARSLVELMNVTLIVIIVCVALIMFGVNLFIFDHQSMFYALVLAYAYGASTGFIFGLMTQVLPMFMVVGYLFVPLTWVSCGVFFIPDALPQQARDIVFIFPMSHIVDFGRTAFYSEYISTYYNLTYVNMVIVANIAAPFAINHFFKAAITSK